MMNMETGSEGHQFVDYLTYKSEDEITRFTGSLWDPLLKLLRNYSFSSIDESNDVLVT